MNYLRTIQQIFTKSIEPKFQLIGMFITSSFLAFFFYGPFIHFNSTNEMPFLHPIVPTKETLGQKSAVEVLVGLHIKNFPTFDVIANDFIADITLWFKFDPALIPLETIEKFSIERGIITEKSEPEINVIGQKLLVRYNMRVQFTSNLDQRAFPFNDHRIYISLTNDNVSPKELIFKSSYTAITTAQKIHAQGWEIIDHGSYAGFTSAKLDTTDEKTTVEHPEVIFFIDFKKAGLRKALAIILPMILIFFLSIITLSLNPTENPDLILGLSSGSLTGLIAHRFVIETIMPNVAYFTLTDHIFNLFLIADFILFLVAVYSVKIAKDTPSLLTIKWITFFLMHLWCISGIYYLLNQWIKV